MLPQISFHCLCRTHKVFSEVCSYEFLVICTGKYVLFMGCLFIKTPSNYFDVSTKLLVNKVIKLQSAIIKVHRRNLIKTTYYKYTQLRQNTGVHSFNTSLRLYFPCKHHYRSSIKITYRSIFCSMLPI